MYGPKLFELDIYCTNHVKIAGHTSVSHPFHSFISYILITLIIGSLISQLSSHHVIRNTQPYSTKLK